eukprot:167004_1
MSVKEVAHIKLPMIPTGYYGQMMYDPSKHYVLFNTGTYIVCYDIMSNKYYTMSKRMYCKSISSSLNSASISVLNLPDEAMTTSYKGHHFNPDIQCVYLPMPINKIHALSSDKTGKLNHFVFSDEKQKFDIVSTLSLKKRTKRKSSLTKSSPEFILRKLLFIQSQNKLIALVTNVSTAEMQLWSCVISNNGECYWKPENVSFPKGREKITNFAAIDVFDSIIVIFYCRKRHKKEMWCLDMMNNVYEWVKSEKIFPNEYNAVDALVNVNDIVHFGCNTKHWKIAAVNILPKSLRVKYMQMYQDLINGYYVSHVLNRNLPIVLNKLIVTFYCNIFNYVCEINMAVQAMLPKHPKLDTGGVSSIWRNFQFDSDSDSSSFSDSSTYGDSTSFSDSSGWSDSSSFNEFIQVGEKLVQI